MTITVFTSNQPRHLSLIRDLAKHCDMVYAVMEVNTVFPGSKPDFFKKSDVMQRYFSHVLQAEKKVFGPISFIAENVRPLVIKSSDINDLPLDILKPALDADYFIVFGASYIKGSLIDHLVDHKAVNIHMGVSPYYRGSSCNFWALSDGNIDLVGATIHLLSKGLDSGPMLFHALPSSGENGFELGMNAVKSAHNGLVKHIADNTLHGLKPVQQDRNQEIRYTKNSDFTDEVAENYLRNLPSKEMILTALETRNTDKYLNPFFNN